MQLFCGDRDFLCAQFVFAFFAQKLKTVFLGLNLSAFKQSNPLATDQNCAKIVQIVQNCANLYDSSHKEGLRMRH